MMVSWFFVMRGRDKKWTQGFGGKACWKEAGNLLNNGGAIRFLS